MSGLEIVGVVLGVLPVAIKTISEYQEIAKRYSFYTKIAEEHARCVHGLNLQLVIFKQHLRSLFLPLDVDKKELDALINDPGGPGWDSPDIERVIRGRLQDSYDVYIQLVKEIRAVAQRLQNELEMGSTDLRTSENTGYQGKRRDKEFRKLYRLKFSNTEGLRNELHAKLVEYNDSMEKLLSASDKIAAAENLRTTSVATRDANSALVNFWKQATNLFNTLASAWNCRCSPGQHCANLRLQHRRQEKVEFSILFSALTQGEMNMRQARIVRQDDDISHANLMAPVETASLPIREPGHRQLMPSKSSIKLRQVEKVTSSRTHVQLLEKPTPSITISSISITETVTTTLISSLCSSLATEHDTTMDCYGYLCDEKCRYYLYLTPSPNPSTIRSISLSEILQGNYRRPTRKQRYSLALNLASSLVQLLQSPWLPLFRTRSDVIFYAPQTETGAMGWLDNPHIAREVYESGDRDGRLFDSFVLLGIILLELCFGESLASHPIRMALGAGDSGNARVEAALDLDAAQEWALEVEEEAGQAYQSAVEWCLTRSRASAKGTDRWREEMLNEVVRPLESCCGHFDGMRPT